MTRAGKGRHVAAGFLALALGLCLFRPAALADEAPGRILSVDHCADQYVLALVAPARIAALSPDAASVYSRFRERAKGLPRVKPEAEALVSRSPDMVVRSWGGGFKMSQALERLKVPVLQLGYANSLMDADDLLLRAGRRLGAKARAEELAQGFRRRLKRLEAVRARLEGARPYRVLYLTSGGFTSGAGTQIDEMIRLAGGENLMGDRTGFLPLSLERLVTLSPDLVVTAFFDLEDSRQGAWAQARHPVLRRMLDETPRVNLPASEIACTAWYSITAAERIQAGLLELAGAARLAANIRPRGPEAPDRRP